MASIQGKSTVLPFQLCIEKCVNTQEATVVSGLNARIKRSTTLCWLLFNAWWMIILFKNWRIDWCPVKILRNVQFWQQNSIFRFKCAKWRVAELLEWKLRCRKPRWREGERSKAVLHFGVFESIWKCIFIFFKLVVPIVKRNYNNTIIFKRQDNSAGSVAILCLGLLYLKVQVFAFLL